MAEDLTKNWEQPSVNTAGGDQFSFSRSFPLLARLCSRFKLDVLKKGHLDGESHTLSLLPLERRRMAKDNASLEYLLFLGTQHCRERTRLSFLRALETGHTRTCPACG